MLEPAYRLAARVVHRLPFPAGTLAESLSGRRRAHERWEDWAATHRAPAALLWAHAASVGEARALEPVLRRLRAAAPRAQIVLTHTSPSLDAVRDLPVDRRDYLPLDEPAPMGRALDALRPTLLLLSRGDLWPELAHGALERGIPVVIAGGTVRPRSARLRPPARWLLRRFHRRLAYLSAVTEADAARWRRLGVPADVVEVTGDPRHDQVLERVPDLRVVRAFAEWSREAASVVVAGSIEPADEPAVVEAIATTAAGHEHRWVLVPHDPTPGAVARLVARLGHGPVRSAVWTGAPAEPVPPAPVVLVTGRGLLADLYLLAAVAYVGGGFRRGRLHAVAEPAAFGLPILAGRLAATTPDGALLARAGGLAPVDSGTTLGRQLVRWGSDPGARTRAGGAARGALAGGAAQRIARAVLPILSGGAENSSRGDPKSGAGRSAEERPAPKLPAREAITSRPGPAP